MLNKVSAVARLVGIALAVVAGFMPELGFDVGLALVVLGIVAGISMAADRYISVCATLLVLPGVASAVGMIPNIGSKLGAIAGGLALLIAGALASSIAITIFNRAKDDLTGLGKSA
jgi:zinc transporter ZupT